MILRNESFCIYICHFSNLFSNDKEGEDMLRNLTRINKPLRITLEQMMRLIGQCDLLDPTKVKSNEVRLRTLGLNDGDVDTNGIQTTTSNSLYSGILPGKYKFCTRILRVIFCLFKDLSNFKQVKYILN